MHDFWQKGSSGILYLLLGVVIIGAFLLVGGIPNLPLSPVDQSQTVELVADTPGASRNNLQLQTLKFKACTNIANVDLLLDRSDSMNLQTRSGQIKLNVLKQAVINLSKNLTDDSVIGIQSFNGDSKTNDVPISLYKDVKSQIPGAVNSLRASGSTPTSDALNFSLDKLKTAVQKYPDRKFAFIFVTDGAPCPGFGCNIPGTDQDPRKATPNPADEIKKLGVTVYTLGIHGIDQYGRLESQDPALSSLLQSIASSPSNYYEAPTGDEVNQILSQISNKICQEPGGTVPSVAP